MGAAEAKPESKLVFPIDLIAFYKLSKKLSRLPGGQKLIETTLYFIIWWLM